MRDPRAGVGGMNHFLLPGALVGKSEGVERGVHAMELLINALLQAGAKRDRLEAKIFGGARMMKNLSDIGAKNASFATDFLRQERHSDHWRQHGRRDRPSHPLLAGHRQAQQRIMGQSENHVFARELSIAATPVAPPADDVEFF